MSKIHIEVTAIRLTEQLIAEKGDFLLIFPDERIEIVEHNSYEWKMIAKSMAEKSEPKPRGRPKKAKPKYDRPKYDRSTPMKGNDLRSSHHRVEYNMNGTRHFMPRTHYQVLEELATWDSPGKIEGYNNSGQASKLRDQGFLEHDPETALWHLSAKGKKVLEAVNGPAN
jgi:hypothetical protein